MTRDVLVGGRAARLRVDGSRAEYTLEGGETVSREFSVGAIGSGLFLVTLDGRSYRVALGGPGEAAVNGRALRIEVFDPRDRRGGAGGGAQEGRQEVAAPMPGKVVRCLVAVGDAVEEAQGLVVVEAMKMQNEMKSPKAGTVVEVRAREGATVVAGEVLVVIE